MEKAKGLKLHKELKVWYEKETGEVITCGHDFLMDCGCRQKRLSGLIIKKGQRYWEG